MQPPQLGSGIGAELLGESGTQFGIGGQRLTRSAAPAQREHQVTPKPFQQGVFRHESTQLHDDGFGLSQLLFFYIVLTCIRSGPPAPAKPWEGADTLEWTLPSPAPYHTFETPPLVK